MDYSELTPEEKLYDAIFDRTALGEVHHWLSDAGKKAINDLLNEFATSPHRHLTKAQSEREIKVLRLRFGFEPRTEAEKKKPHLSNCRSLEEVTPYFGVTRERIRQIEAKTLRMLRHPAYTRRLMPYLEGRI